MMIAGIVVSVKQIDTNLLKCSQEACESPYSIRPATEAGTGSERLNSQDLDFITCLIYRESAVNSCI